MIFWNIASRNDGEGGSEPTKSMYKGFIICNKEKIEKTQISSNKWQIN